MALIFSSSQDLRCFHESLYEYMSGSELFLQSFNTETSQYIFNSLYIVHRSFTPVINTYNSNMIRLLLLLLSAVYANAGTTFSMSLQSCEGATDEFTLSSTSLDCTSNSYGYCYWGGAASINGYFTLASELDSYPVANVTAYVFGSRVFRSTNSNLCQKGAYQSGGIKKFTSTKGRYCPAAGNYKFSKNVTLPKNPNSWSAIFGNGQVSDNSTIAFDFGQNSTTTCYLSLQVTNNRSSSSSSFSYSSSGAAVVLLLFAGGVRSRRRRRNVAIIDADQLQDHGTPQYDVEPITDYEMIRVPSVMV